MNSNTNDNHQLFRVKRRPRAIGERTVRATVVALLSASSVDAATTECTNDQRGDDPDTGCSSEAPLCVTAKGREPAWEQAGSWRDRRGRR